MFKKLKGEQHILEVMLIIVAIALTCLTYKMEGHKLVILNLFYLPVVLAGFFMGRYRAGILALFCVISVSLVTALQLSGFVTTATPVTIALAVTISGAILCLTDLLVGTLSDERSAQADELHDAYVGVVEVLSKYLQGANPQLKARTIRVAELSQQIAKELKLPGKGIDDIRVAALMHDLGKIEVTTKLITKAVDTLEANPEKLGPYSFHGTDLVHSLGSVLRGAIPILLNQDSSMPALTDEDHQSSADIPMGAKVIRAARAYDLLTACRMGSQKLTSEEALRDLRRDRAANHDPAVLDALDSVIQRSMPAIEESVCV